MGIFNMPELPDTTGLISRGETLLDTINDQVPVLVANVGGISRSLDRIARALEKNNA
jgi:hypothetical protein